MAHELFFSGMLLSLVAFMLPRTSKVIERCQSGDDGLRKRVRLFRYFYWWLLGKSFLKFNNRTFSDCCTLLNGTSQEKKIDFGKSLAYFGALISDEGLGQVSLKSEKSTYPIYSFK